MARVQSSTGVVGGAASLTLQRSRFNNSRVGITGMLVYVKSRFFQLLEWPSDAVAETYARIGRDPRHMDVTELEDFTSPTRHFPAWTMGFTSPNAAILAKMGGYSDLREPGSPDLERLKSHSNKIFRYDAAHRPRLCAALCWRPATCRSSPDV